MNSTCPSRPLLRHDAAATVASPPGEADPALDEPVTIVIARRVRGGHEALYEELVRDFVPVALSFAGHLGMHVTKLANAAGPEYHVVIKFATRKHWQAFQNWPPYQAFREAIEPLLESSPSISELSGLESWFVPPAAPLRAFPRWKLAIVTFLAVYPTSLALNLLLGGLLHDAATWMRVLILSFCMVAFLTWLAMPLATQLFAGWLSADDEHEEPRRTDSRPD